MKTKLKWDDYAGSIFNSFYLIFETVFLILFWFMFLYTFFAVLKLNGGYIDVSVRIFSFAGLFFIIVRFIKKIRVYYKDLEELMKKGD